MGNGRKEWKCHFTFSHINQQFPIGKPGYITETNQRVLIHKKEEQGTISDYFPHNEKYKDVYKYTYKSVGKLKNALCSKRICHKRVCFSSN